MNFFSNVVAASSSGCEKGPNWELFIHCCLAPSLIIVLLLSFFGKRYNFRLNSLFGIKHLSVVCPINLLDDHEHRWSHALAFGAAASMIMLLFSGGYATLYMSNPGDAPTWVQILLGVVATIELGTILFPFFACITSPSRFVGSLLGLIYAAVWFAVLLTLIITCPNPDRGGFDYESLILQLPVLIFTFLLTLRFLYYLIKSVKKRVRGTKLTADEKLRKSHQGQHVTALLRPPLPPRIYHRRWERFLYSFYEPTSSFVYPTRIISTFVVAVLCEYQLAVSISYGFDQFLGRAFDSIQEWYAVYVITYNITETVAAEKNLAISRYESAAHVSWYLACALAIIISLCYIAHIFVCFRKHVLRLYKGDRRFLPEVQQPSAQSMTGSLQYCGFQIAYYLSGYVIMTFMVFFVIYLISGALVIPLIKDALQVFLAILNVVLPLFVVIFLVFGSQPILARKVFLQPKLDQNDKDKPLALQHRDFYHIFSYFLVFLNVLVGLMACVIRICIGLVVGVFLLCRIDRPILMRGYENLDQSYQAYIGNLNMINAHSHPVLVVFCQVLVNRIMVRKRAKLGRSKESNIDDTTSYAFVEHDIESISPHSRAVLRWQLAYTLLFNPSLLNTRKRSRQITFQELEKRILKVSTLLPHRQQVLQRTKAAAAAGGGRVVSAPTFYPDADDRLAAELLNRELMADESDRDDHGVAGNDGGQVESGNDGLVKNDDVIIKDEDKLASDEPVNLRSFGIYLRNENDNGEVSDDQGPNRGSQNDAYQKETPVPINAKRSPIQRVSARRQPQPNTQPQAAANERRYEKRHSAKEPRGSSEKRNSSEIVDDHGTHASPQHVDHENVVIHLDVPQRSSTDDPDVVGQ